MATVNVNVEALKTKIKVDGLWEIEQLVSAATASNRKLGSTTVFEMLRTGEGSMKTLEKIVSTLNSRLEYLKKPQTHCTAFILPPPSSIAPALLPIPPVPPTAPVIPPAVSPVPPAAPEISPNPPIVPPTAPDTHSNKIKRRRQTVAVAVAAYLLLSKRRRQIIGIAAVTGLVLIIGTAAAILLSVESDLERFRRLLSRRLVGHNWKQPEMIFRDRTGKEWAGLKLGNVLRARGEGKFLSVDLEPGSVLRKQSLNRINGKQQVEWLCDVRAVVPFSGESTVRISYPIVGDREFPGPTYKHSVAGSARLELRFELSGDSVEKVGFYTVAFDGKNPRYNDRFVIEEVLGPQLQRCVVETLAEIGINVDVRPDSFTEH